MIYVAYLILWIIAGSFTVLACSKSALNALICMLLWPIVLPARACVAVWRLGTRLL